jgi:hypothetical protein
MREGAPDGPVLFAYDGSTQAKEAIRKAGQQLRDGRHAIVLTVWQPLAALPFAGAPGVPPVGLEEGIERQARRVAEEGAKLARATGFDADAIAERGIRSGSGSSTRWRNTGRASSQWDRTGAAGSNSCSSEASRRPSRATRSAPS